MLAMLFEAPGEPLREVDLPIPKPGGGQFLVKISACAVCRTDLHVVEGDLTEPRLPLVPSHEIVGTIEERGEGVEDFAVGDRVGITWLGWSCQKCPFKSVLIVAPTVRIFVIRLALPATRSMAGTPTTL